MSESSTAITHVPRASSRARVIAVHWPALLVGSGCVGLAAGNIVGHPLLYTALAAAGVLAIALVDGPWRIAALGLALAAAGLWWGSLRLEAMAESALAAEVGRHGDAELVVVGAARRTSWAVRVPAEVRSFHGRDLHERVLLVLPVGRSPPRGAILEARVRVTEPRPAEGGFDEEAWLSRQGIHVVVRATSWQQIGRRGGVSGLGDRLRDRIETAVGRGTTGVRRGLVLGVVLGEDEGLPTRVREEFRASGLAHLLMELTIRQN